MHFVIVALGRRKYQETLMDSAYENVEIYGHFLSTIQASANLFSLQLYRLFQAAL